MNKRVLETMICLVWVFLLIFEIMSLGFHGWFEIKIDNEKLRAVGEYLDTHFVVAKSVSYVCSLVTYFLYFGAACKKWILPKTQALVAFFTITIIQILIILIPTIGNYLGTVAMIFLPFVFGADYGQVAIVFSLHFIGQLLLLNIRRLPIFLMDTEFATKLVLLIDNYLWLLLLYLYSNKYKGDFKWAKFHLHCSEKNC